jgi:hypothetical protein
MQLFLVSRNPRRWATLLVLQVALLIAAAFVAPAAFAADGRVDLSSVAAITAYLQSQGYDPSNALVQEGTNNYAGASCPGAGWACANPAAGRIVIQRASGPGQNKFEGTGSTCIVVQTAMAGANAASCVQRSTTNGSSVDASITQQNVNAGDVSVVDQDSSLSSGSTQSLAQRSRVHQQIVNGGTGANSSTLSQALSESIDSSGPVTQTQLSSQKADLDQFTVSGANSSTMTVNLKQRENAAGGTIVQNQNASGTEQYLQTSVNQRSDAGGAQNSSLTARTDQQAVVNPAAGSVTQKQGCATCGVIGSLMQDSAGVSTASANISERQHLVANGATSKHQTQYGPVDVPGSDGLPPVGPNGVRCCSDQIGNPNNTFTINIDSDQKAEADADQFNYVRGSCHTDGTCNVGLAVSQNGTSTSNSCSGEDCSIAVQCLDTTPCDTADTDAPETSITAAPSGTTASSSATFEFTGTEPGSFICALDDATWEACSSPKTYTSLATGSHLFRVSAVDLARNVDQSPAEATWSIDTTPPDTILDSAPSGFTNATSGTITFHASEAGATFECRIDGSAWTACTSPKTFTGLGNGTHTAEVRAKDSLGNADPTPAAASWTVDVSAPSSTFTTANGSTHVGNPPGADNVEGTASDNLSGIDKVRVTFTTLGISNTMDAALTCNASRTSCTWKAAISGLPPGSYTVTKQAFDRAANSDTPTSITIFVV